MLFDKDDIEEINGNKVVDAEKVIDRFTDSIKEALAYSPDYYNWRSVIRLDDAEELLLELYRVIKKLK